MVYQEGPPYRILKNDLLDFPTVQRVSRFARYWDLMANSGRFVNTMPLLLGNSPFERFLALSDWLFVTTGQTHKIALPRLFRLVADASSEIFPDNDSTDQGVSRLLAALQTDFNNAGFSGDLVRSARTKQLRPTRKEQNSSRPAEKVELAVRVEKSERSNSPDPAQVKPASPNPATQKLPNPKLRQHRHLAGS